MQRLLGIIVLSCISLTIHALPDLKQVYQTALTSDPVLKQQRANTQASVEARKQSTAALLPSLSLSTDLNRNQRKVTKGAASLKDSNSIQYGLRLQQPVFRLDLWALRKQGKLGEKVQQAQLENTKQNLILRVSNSYFQVLAAVDSLEFARAEKKAVARQLEQVKKRFEVGLIAITDVQESKARYDLTVAQEIEAENQLSLSLEFLSELTGKIYQTLKALGSNMPLRTPVPSNTTTWVSTAMAQSPLVAIAKLNLQIANAQIKLQRAGHWPTVDITGSYVRDKDDGNIFFQERESTRIGVTVGLSLFAGGLVRAKTREAQHLFIAAQELLEQQTRSTTRETRAAYQNVVAAISRVNALQQALKSTETALKATQAGFEVGTRTSVDILDAQRELFRSQRDYSQTRYNYIQNLLRLKLAAGILNAKDIDEINVWLN